MTLDAWLVRLRMMSRSSVVELSPEEVGDLVSAIGPGGDAAAAEREACAVIADGMSLAGLEKFDGGSQTRTGEAIATCIRARGTGG